MLGDGALIDREVGEHISVTAQEIQEVSGRLFRRENSSTLLYLAESAE